MSDKITLTMVYVIAKIDRIKDRQGWALVAQLKNLGVHGQTLRALRRRCLIEAMCVGPIDDWNCVRLTKEGRRYV